MPVRPRSPVPRNSSIRAIRPKKKSSKVRVSCVPSLDVVSVKPLGPKDHFGPQLGCTGERFESARPLIEVLIWVFDVEPYQLIGIPDWDPKFFYNGVSGLFRIDAVASHPVIDAECKVMVQQLLEDRYKMIAHRESRETPVYALVVAKNGPKVAKADENAGVRVIVNGNPMGIAVGTAKDVTGATGAQTGVREGAYRYGRD